MTIRSLIGSRGVPGGAERKAASGSHCDSYRSTHEGSKRLYYDLVIGEYNIDRRHRLVCAGNPALRERKQAALSTKRLLLVSGLGGGLEHSSYLPAYGGFKSCGVNSHGWLGKAPTGCSGPTID
jgi:hypothetical protein